MGSDGNGWFLTLFLILFYFFEHARKTRPIGSEAIERVDQGTACVDRVCLSVVEALRRGPSFGLDVM